MNQTEKLTTYAQVCEVENVDPVQSLPFPNPETGEQKALNAVAKCWRIVRVFNRGEKPNFDSNSTKYSIWWYMRSQAAGGPGFSYHDYAYDCSSSTVGARLSFLDYEAMKWVANQPEFVEIFKEAMTFSE